MPSRTNCTRVLTTSNVMKCDVNIHSSTCPCLAVATTDRGYLRGRVNRDGGMPGPMACVPDARKPTALWRELPLELVLGAHMSMMVSVTITLSLSSEISRVVRRPVAAAAAAAADGTW